VTVKTTAYNKGFQAASDGQPMGSNPYQEYYMRRHPWSGWMSRCCNPAHSEWRLGHWERTMELVCAAIETVLKKRGPLDEVEFGLGVMSEFDGDLTGDMMRSAVCRMIRDGKITGDYGRYDLAQ